MKQSFSIISLLLLHTVLPSITGAGQAHAAKAKKANGSHLIVVTGPEEYWKTLGSIAVDAAEKLIKQGAVITMPFIESKKLPEVLAWNKAYKKYYKKGVKYFKKGDYKKCIARLTKAITTFTTFSKTSGWSYTLRRRTALAYMYMGAAQLLEAQIEEARTSFRLANSLYAGYPLPKAAFSAESTLAAFNKAVEAPGGGTGEVIVNSKVTGFVFIDGHLAGVTPLIISNVAPGTHGISFGRMGYKPIFTSVKVSESSKGVANFEPVKTKEDIIKGYLNPINSDLRRAKKDVPAKVKELATRVRTKNIIFVRSSANDTEMSWYEATNQSWQKRVRRENAVPGNMETAIWKSLLKPKPIFDLGNITSNTDRCFSSRDCPGGDCIGGKCISSTPVYKTWWFWTAIGVGVTALGGGTYLLLKIKNRPAFEFTSP